MPDITAPRPVSGEPVATAWGDQVHDLLEGIQAGKVSLVFSNLADSAVVTVVFPRAYTAPPVVVLGMETGVSRAPVAKIVNGSITATQFQMQAQDTAGTVRTGTMPASWLAIGTPA